MKNRTTKKSLLFSLISLVVCVSMLVGTTFAWFTDQVFSGKNVITSGNLDLEMYWTDDLGSGVWHNVEDEEHNTIFSYDNWEPGYTDVKYIKLVNNGDLAFNYKLNITPQSEVGELAEVINVYFANGGVVLNSRDDLSNLRAIGLLENVLDGDTTASGTLLSEDQYNPDHPSGETIVTIAMSMITSAGNKYQNKDAGKFTITALAAQASYEKDSFGADYDASAEYPVQIVPGKATAKVTPVNGMVPDGGITMYGQGISATVPAGVKLADGAQELTLKITPLKNSTSDIVPVNNQVLMPVDVHIDGVAEDNTVPIIVNLGNIMPKYLNMGNYSLYHIEDGQTEVMTLVDGEADLVAHNRYTYHPNSGNITIAVATFSEFDLLTDTVSTWEGNEDYTWYDPEYNLLYIANADQLYSFAKIVGGMADGIERDTFEGKTVKLLSDINLNYGNVFIDETDICKIFYPIGYYNNVDGEASGIYDRTDSTEIVGKQGVYSNVSAFCGTFDGNGNTVSNFYQNTWEMFGDYNNGYDGTPNYYKDAMGLFGYVKGGTVKNLTVDSFTSDGEFTPTGVIAAYADGDAHFENIAITNCNPRVYNTGNGGIIGIAGSTDTDDDSDIILKNITVDDTNKITALWGSWDVACGGLVGMYRGNVDANGIDTGDTIDFINCNVSAQIDVYNDVCANYQYYAYRYSGMIIGSVRHNTNGENGRVIPDMTGISATACLVEYDTWNDYFYCELVANSKASYTHDHQFSRLTRVESVDPENMTYVPLGGTETQVPTSGRYNFVVVDGDYATENAECYHFADGEIWEHSDAGKETVNGVETDVEDHAHIYLPFSNLFTGYGWGVTSKGIEDFEGVDTMSILTTEVTTSVEKFSSEFDATEVHRVSSEKEISLSELFDAVENPARPINTDNVQVTFNKLDQNATVSETYTADSENWQNGTVTFTGVGQIKVTIQDYDYCKPAYLVLEVLEDYEMFDFSDSVTSRFGTANKQYMSDTGLGLVNQYYVAGGEYGTDGTNKVLVQNVDADRNSTAKGVFRLHKEDSSSEYGYKLYNLEPNTTYVMDLRVRCISNSSYSTDYQGDSHYLYVKFGTGVVPEDDVEVPKKLNSLFKTVIAFRTTDESFQLKDSDQEYTYMKPSSEWIDMSYTFTTPETFGDYTNDLAFESLMMGGFRAEVDDVEVYKAN